MTSSAARRCLLRIVQMKSMADHLPSVFSATVKNGKMAVLVLVGVYFCFLGLWLPFWGLSFVVTEWGIYALAIATVFFIGRSIIRMIAFPGASARVSGEMEREFANYSAKILTSAATSLMELAETLLAVSQTESPAVVRQRIFELPSLWRRAKTYRDRVLAVYRDVLTHLYQLPPPADDPPGDFTKYGNNRLSGDIGNLSGLTPEARQDGRELLDRLHKILQLLDGLEVEAKPLLTSRGSGSPAVLSESAKVLAIQLVQAATELQFFASSLKPEGPVGDELDEEDPVDTVRRRVEAESSSAIEAVKSGLSSILPMLDPPPHTSIFGLDVQRGCMLSRYCGARQLWVRRPQGGLLDVLHFRARPVDGRSLQGAVLYCNPNAGLIEVAAGLSLVGGNVPSGDGDSSAQSWVDYYTDLGYDVYVFNYAGYGRSFGTTLCHTSGSSEQAFFPGFLARCKRIVRSSFLSFQPTPDTLRADGIAVAQHLINDVGVPQLVIHGESIGGVAATATARHLTTSHHATNRVALLVCDRTFCNLEAVAQRLVGGWSGYAIRALAPLWSTDVAGDFLAATCPKVVACDSADMIIADQASLKTGIAIWKELHRGISSTKGIAWIPETPLQYRMAEFENVCVSNSRYVASNSLLQTKAPTWPADKHISLDEAFHFAACCKRIGKLATRANRQSRVGEDSSMEFEELGVSQPSVIMAWMHLGSCDGLTGSTLGVAVKRGFDATVAWLCAALVFGGQSVVATAEMRYGESNSPSQVTAVDFDSRPLGWERLENEGQVFPKPIPDVLQQLVSLKAAGDDSIANLSHEIVYVIGILEYIQSRLLAAPNVESARQIRGLMATDSSVGSFFNLQCGHNNPFSKDERRMLRLLLERASSRR